MGTIVFSGAFARGFPGHLAPSQKMTLHNLRFPQNFLFCYLPLAIALCAFFLSRLIKLIGRRKPVEGLPFMFMIFVLCSALTSDEYGNVFQSALGYWAFVWVLIYRKYMTMENRGDGAPGEANLPDLN